MGKDLESESSIFFSNTKTLSPWIFQLFELAARHSGDTSNRLSWWKYHYICANNAKQQHAKHESHDLPRKRGTKIMPTTPRWMKILHIPDANAVLVTHHQNVAFRLEPKMADRAAKPIVDSASPRFSVMGKPVSGNFLASRCSGLEMMAAPISAFPCFEARSTSLSSL